MSRQPADNRGARARSKTGIKAVDIKSQITRAAAHHIPDPLGHISGPKIMNRWRVKNMKPVVTIVMGAQTYLH